MDNLTHTLAGALLAECGLKHRSRLAYPALLIGANLPDIDALSYVVSDSLTALSFRRGWTHGVLAMAVWPFVLALLLTAWDLARRPKCGGELDPTAPRESFLTLAGVAAIGIVSHPLLDLVNNYGVRLLMPFSQRWFYGDAIFIVDPWILTLLVSGVIWSRRRARAGVATARGARVALVALVAYIGGMTCISRATAQAVARAAGIAAPVSPRVLMMSPEPVRVTTRVGLLDTGTSYERWRAEWRPWGTRVQREAEAVDKGDTDPRAARTRATAAGARFLAWSRFPYFVCGVDGDPNVVHLGDARYTAGVIPSWASTRVSLPSLRVSALAGSRSAGGD